MRKLDGNAVVILWTCSRLTSVLGTITDSDPGDQRLTMVVNRCTNPRQLHWHPASTQSHRAHSRP